MAKKEQIQMYKHYTIQPSSLLPILLKKKMFINTYNILFMQNYVKPR